MNASRRDFLAAGIMTCSLNPSFAALATKPSVPTFERLRIIIPANAGGGWDQTGRALGNALVASGQVGNIEYENKGGKGGILGLAHYVERYANDANTLLVGGFVMVGSIALNKPKIDLASVTPVARLTTELLMVAVASQSKLRDLRSFETMIKADPTAATIAGGGAGGVDHMCAAMIARASGADLGKLAYQPFSSGPEVLDAVANGKVVAGISGYGELKEGLASGRLRALGLSSRRSAFGIPSFREQGIDVDLGNWRGVFAAKGLNEANLDALRGAVQKATQYASWKEALVANSWQPAWLAGADLKQAIETDQSMASALVHMLHLKPS